MMAAPGVRYQRQKANAEQVLSWLKGWDALDPARRPMNVADWIALKLSCSNQVAKNRIIAALRVIGVGRIGVEVQRSDAVKRALALLGRAAVPKDMGTKEAVAWRDLATPILDGAIPASALIAEGKAAQAPEVVQPKTPESLEPARVLDYLSKEEARLVQRLRATLLGAGHDLDVAASRVKDEDDGCHVDQAVPSVLAHAYRLAGELHRIREVLALLKTTAGFEGGR
jgi:hypothetical protein